MRTGDLAPMGRVGSTVEADETFIGRKDGTIRRRGHGLLSLVDRKSVEGTSAADIVPIIKANVAKETAMITDEGGHYSRYVIISRAMRASAIRPMNMSVATCTQTRLRAITAFSNAA